CGRSKSRRNRNARMEMRSPVRCFARTKQSSKEPPGWTSQSFLDGDCWGTFAMAHDSQPAIHAADTGRLACRVASTARGRYRARLLAQRQVSLLPEIGADDVILPTFEETLDSFAMRAQQGDRIARDALYRAYRPKLDR